MTANRSEAPSSDVALKTLWGASRWPASPDSNLVLAHPAWNDAMRRLDQLAAVHASGVVHGAHGIGKSFLLHRWTERLPAKHYRVLRLAHSSLMGSDLLRQLVRLAGKTPLFRRGDNVAALADLWSEWAPSWPVIVLEEAQDLNVAALEELRLLTSSRSDAKAPFSLILCGDDELVPRLDLGINRALMSRLGFCLHLERWSPDTLGDYLKGQLADVGIHTSPFEPAAHTLIIQAAQGTPRTLNALVLRSMEQAAHANRRSVTAADVQAALDVLPWLARPRSQAAS